MWYTNIVRTCLSNFGRVHGQVNGQVHGQIHIGRTNFTQSSRLVTTRLFGALTPRLSQHDSKVCILTPYPFTKCQNLDSLKEVADDNENQDKIERCSSGRIEIIEESQTIPSHWVKGVFNTQISRYSVTSKQSPESGPNTDKAKTREERKRDETDRLRGFLQDGLLPLRKPQTVTSLPKEFKMTGNETFIACEMYTSGSLPYSEVFLITASSGSDKFQRVCKPVDRLTPPVVHQTGMVYNKGQVSRDGHPVELTEPREALQQFIDFVRKYDQPVLIFSNFSRNVKRFSLVMKKWGIINDFISTAPYSINAHTMAQRMPREEGEDYKVPVLCKKLMGLQIPDGDVEMKMHGLHRLFTEHLLHLPKGYIPDLSHTDQFYTKNSLVRMMINEGVTLFTVNRLAHAGIGIDHLNFLAKKGSVEFVRYLMDMKIKTREAERLFSALKKENTEL